MRVEKENSGFFPDPLDVIIGYFGQGEGGSDPSGVVEGSGTSWYSTGTEWASNKFWVSGGDSGSVSLIRAHNLMERNSESLKRFFRI